MHGYDLRKRLRGDFGLLSSLSFGSLYPALARLEAAGAVHEVPSGHTAPDSAPGTFTSAGSIAGERAAFMARLASRRAAATRSGTGTRGRRVYELTARGDEMFHHLLETEEPKPEGGRGFALRWAFARYLSPDARLLLLQRRRAQLVDAREGSRRAVESPWRPGLSRKQAPSHMLCLSIYPAKGCEEMNVGWCSFPRFVWKPEKDGSPCSAGWSQVFRSPPHHRASEKILRGFMKKYRLVKMPDKQVQDRRWSQCSRETLYCLGGASVMIWAAYRSHRRGYGPGRIELSLPDYQNRRIGFRFRGTLEEGRKLFQGVAFQADLKDMLYGEEHVIAAAHGVWSSFCKTQYSNDPRCGGWDNFQRAHLSVCAILEHMQEIGFTVHVSDEGGFWEKRDLAALAKEIGEWDAMLAGLGGVFKDAAEAQVVGFESSMSGRPDFERLEVEATKIGKIASHLEKLREAVVPRAAGIV